MMENRIFKFLSSKGFTYFLISSFIWAFFVVNMISYDNSIFSFNFSNLSNLSFSFQANNEGIELYFSILTVTGLFLAIIQFIFAINHQEIDEKSKSNAIINGLLQEIRHNIDLVDYLQYNKEEIIRMQKKISKILDINKINCYPNFVDKDKINTYKLDDFQITTLPLTALTEIQTVLKLRFDFLQASITNIAIFNNPYIYLNLGHLLFSINRFNLSVEYYNKFVNKVLDSLGDDIKFKKNKVILNLAWKELQKEYFEWLHLRLHFMQIDLIKSFNADDFIDKAYVSEIKKIIEED